MFGQHLKLCVFLSVNATCQNGFYCIHIRYKCNCNFFRLLSQRIPMQIFRIKLYNRLLLIVWAYFTQKSNTFQRLYSVFKVHFHRRRTFSNALACIPGTSPGRSDHKRNLLDLWSRVGFLCVFKVHRAGRGGERPTGEAAPVRFVFCDYIVSYRTFCNEYLIVYH